MPLATPIGHDHAPWRLDDLIVERSVVCHFQPLVMIRSRRVLAVEALCRGVDPASGHLIPPGELFGLVRSREQLIALDRLCRSRSLQAFSRLLALHPGLVLSLNFEASLLDLGVLGSGRLLAQVQECGIDPRQVIIEIIESRVGDAAALARFAQTHRDHGFLLALDDVGAGHSNLERVAIIKPDVIKIDRSIVTGLDRHYYKQEVARSLVNLANKIGALVVAEGVEAEAEALAAVEIGVEILQGFYLGRPVPLPDLDGACRRVIERLAARFGRHIIDKIGAKKDLHDRYGAVVSQIAEVLAGAQPEDFDLALPRLLELHRAIECVYVLDRQGRQVSLTVCDLARLRPQGAHVYRPAPKGADQSLKDYYLLLAAGLPRYVSEPYISRASGNLCLTISTWFRARQGGRYIVCVDFDSSLFASLEGRVARGG